VLLVQKDAQSTALSLGYPWALRRDNPDFFKMMVAVSALGEHRQFSGRLMRSLRVERGLNYGDYAYVEHFAQAGESTFPMLNVARRQQDFTVWLRPVATENQLFAIRAALFVLERYAKNGMTQAELDQTRGFMEGYTLLWEQTPMRRLGYAMDDMFYGVEMGFLERFRASLKKMQLADVNQAVAKWLRPGNLEIAAVTKDGETLRMAMLEDAPSPIHYVAEKPSPNVLAEDEKIVRLPLDLLPDKAVIEPATELFER
jgi:zinc protease